MRGQIWKLAEAALILAFLASAALAGVAASGGPGRAPSAGPYSAYASMTPSMEPTFGPGRS